jgi:hypothetical protein
MLLGVRHLICKDTLQRRQTPTSFFKLNEPSLTVGHTSYAISDAGLRNAAELIGKTARCPHAFAEVPLYFFLSHDEGLLQNFLHFKACIKFCCLYDEGSNSKGRYSKMTITTDLIGIGYMLSIAADKANLVDLSDSTPLKERLATVYAFIDALDDLHGHTSTIANNLTSAIDSGAK